MALGTATAGNIETVLITRFFAGFFGSAPITCMGGTNVDLWHATERGNAIVGYMLAVSAALVSFRLLTLGHDVPRRTPLYLSCTVSLLHII